MWSVSLDSGGEYWLGYAGRKKIPESIVFVYLLIF